MLLPVVDEAGDEVERDALPAPPLSVDPAGAVAAGGGAVDVGGAVELAGHRALQLHLPRRRGPGHRDLFEPLDRPVAVHDLTGRVLGDGQLERAVVLVDGFALVLVGDDRRELAVSRLLFARRGVVRGEAVLHDLAVGERHPVAVLGHDGDPVGLGDAADEVGERRQGDALVLRRRRDRAGAALDAGVPFVGRQRLQLAHRERPAAVVALDGQDDGPGRRRRRRGLVAGAAAAGGGQSDQAHGQAQHAGRRSSARPRPADGDGRRRTPHGAGRRPSRPDLPNGGRPAHLGSR